ncbi:MAG: ExbD/TolR family protein [Planctomycetaceae bacterium]
MPLKTDTIEEPHLNLTPMIDIVFLLIIFFMVGTQFTDEEQQFTVQLPTVATAAEPLTSRPDEISIVVAANGEIQLDGEPRSLEQLETGLKARRANYAEQGVIIRGAGEGDYQNIMDVLAACDRAGIRNVNLANRYKTTEE